MKKWILCLSFFLPFFGWSENVAPESDLTQIEQEIQMLKDRLQQMQIKEISEEVKGQGLMIADWDAYAKEIELIREQDKEEKNIRLKIQQLEERKAHLMNSRSSSK